jgi:hypothetical protein
LKNVSDYRFPEATRKNNPPAKIAAEGFVPLIPKKRRVRLSPLFSGQTGQLSSRLRGRWFQH